jgi:hypothetical protein
LQEIGDFLGDGIDDGAWMRELDVKKTCQRGCFRARRNIDVRTMAKPACG